jgi:hypothetical protein
MSPARSARATRANCRHSRRGSIRAAARRPGAGAGSGSRSAVRVGRESPHSLSNRPNQSRGAARRAWPAARGSSARARLVGEIAGGMQPAPRAARSARAPADLAGRRRDDLDRIRHRARGAAALGGHRRAARRASVGGQGASPACSPMRTGQARVADAAMLVPGAAPSHGHVESSAARRDRPGHAAPAELHADLVHRDDARRLRRSRRRPAEAARGGDAQHGVTIEKILMTHGHIDHCGGAGEFAEELGVPIEGPHEADRFWIAPARGGRPQIWRARRAVRARPLAGRWRHR